ncbi:DnaJ domain-containing protein [Novosphingobium sp. CF614]|uniref:J domain-containing protein n=1 Tax=Novosphingobium sp. CF614 TaxID=1884364 RepID=UPI0008E39248|nr:J domain-containing protein [Novosphingobium sp. CF614]SFG20953.1 DnaJ domain-containing protein [Novosphingobium sp. CF614]
MRGSYYDLLRVSSTASREEIKARYLVLMRRYHPDVNQSPLAHARAAELNEAFRILMDGDLRAGHDAELAQRRRDVVTARAVSLSRGSRSRALVVRRRRPLLRRYGAQLALAVVLAATIVAGWEIERRLLLRPDAAFSAVSIDNDNSEAKQAIAALKAASVREAEAMPPVSSTAIMGAMDAFRRMAADGDMVKARAFSERCHTQRADIDTWDALDLCVAFDQAVFMRYGKDLSVPAANYFVDRHDDAAHLYMSRIPSMDAIGMRLDQIRGRVAPKPDQKLQARTAQALHRIAKYGWKFARSIFIEDNERGSRSHDF